MGSDQAKLWAIVEIIGLWDFGQIHVNPVFFVLFSIICFFCFFFWLNLEPSIFPTHPLATWARPQGHIANTCRAAIFHSPVFPSLFLLSVTCKTEIFGRLWSCIPLTLNYWDIIFSLVNNLVASMSSVYVDNTAFWTLALCCCC